MRMSFVIVHNQKLYPISSNGTAYINIAEPIQASQEAAVSAGVHADYFLTVDQDITDVSIRKEINYFDYCPTDQGTERQQVQEIAAEFLEQMLTPYKPCAIA